MCMRAQHSVFSCFLNHMMAMIKKHGREVLRVLGSVARCYCLIHCAAKYGGQIVRCRGPSMEPTICDNDVLFLKHVAPSKKSLKKGDIIIAKSPMDPKSSICKRIIAFEDDEVLSGFTKNIVPKGHVWLEGDNRGNSNDSRSFGPVPLGLVKGRAIFRVYPFDDRVLLTTNKHI